MTQSKPQKAAEVRQGRLPGIRARSPFVSKFFNGRQIKFNFTLLNAPYARLENVKSYLGATTKSGGRAGSTRDLGVVLPGLEQSSHGFGKVIPCQGGSMAPAPLNTFIKASRSSKFNASLRSMSNCHGFN